MSQVHTETEVTCARVSVSSPDYRAIKVANKLSGSVTTFKYYLGTTLTNHNCVYEETKRRLNSENACCHAVLNPLSVRLKCKH